MSNFFLVYRPFHFDYVLQVIRLHFADGDNTVINHYQSGYLPDNLPGTLKILEVSQSGLKRVAALRRAADLLRDAARGGGLVNVFIPHTLGVLSNYSYHRLARRYPNVRISVFYEGVIAFYGYRHSYAANLSYYFSRWIASALSGIRYTFENRLLDFHDRRVSAIYSPFTALDAPAGKVVETPLQKIDFTPREDTCIILGLKLAKGQEADTDRIINAIFDQVSLLALRTVYYKEHPAEASPRFPEIAKARHIELKVIESKSPVENLIAGLAPKYVYSIWSSGLVNLKHILPPGTEVSSFLTEQIASEGDIPNLVSSFRANGIRVVFV